MPRPSLFSSKFDDDAKFQRFISDIPRACVPDAKKRIFQRFADDDLLPHNTSDDDRGGLRDCVQNALQLRTFAAQVRRGNEYKPVDTNERGQAMPHVTIQFASGKNGTSFLGVDLFLFEVPVAYQVLGAIAAEYAPRTITSGESNSSSSSSSSGSSSIGEPFFAVRACFERRVVAALRGHVVRKCGNQYQSRDILLLKTLLAMMNEKETFTPHLSPHAPSSASSSSASSSSTSALSSASSANSTNSSSVNSSSCRFPCIELVARIIAKPGNHERERATAMMLAASELYVDVRVLEQETRVEKRRLFFYARADGRIDKNDAPQSIQNSIPAATVPSVAA